MFAIHLGRILRKSEDVHHKNNNKLDFRLRNLQMMDHRKHGFVSAKQRWYVTKIVLPKQEAHELSYFAEDVSFEVESFTT